MREEIKKIPLEVSLFFIGIITILNKIYKGELKVGLIFIGIAIFLMVFNVVRNKDEKGKYVKIIIVNSIYLFIILSFIYFMTNVYNDYMDSLENEFFSSQVSFGEDSKRDTTCNVTYKKNIKDILKINGEDFTPKDTLVADCSDGHKEMFIYTERMPGIIIFAFTTVTLYYTEDIRKKCLKRIK